MNKIKNFILYFIIIVLVIISIIVLFKVNTISNNKKISKKQLTEEIPDNAYVSAQRHIFEVNDQEQKLLNFKSSIANAITNQGITTYSSDTAEKMSTNIANILKEKTKNATATADNISKGKTAWVNGELITGNGADNNYYKDLYSPNLKVVVTRTHIDGSGYADKQTVNVVVYYNDEIVINQSMTNSSAYNQSATYTYPQ